MQFNLKIGVKEYLGKNSKNKYISKNLSSKYSQNFLDNAKQSATDALKTSFKLRKVHNRAIQKQLHICIYIYIYIQKKDRKLLMISDYYSSLIMKYQKNNKFIRQYAKSIN